MESGFPQPDVDPTPDMVIGAALLAPCFCEDLSTWRMAVNRDGTVIQELRPGHPSELYDPLCIHLRSFVGEDRLALIQSIAEEIGFDSLGNEYHAGCTDLEHTSITLNHRGQAKRVLAYGPHFLAHEGSKEMIGYVRLWDLLVEISPYQYTTATPLPDEDVRKKLRIIFGKSL
jgi:hypothetical protein